MASLTEDARQRDEVDQQKKKDTHEPHSVQTRIILRQRWRSWPLSNEKGLYIIMCRLLFRRNEVVCLNAER